MGSLPDTEVSATQLPTRTASHQALFPVEPHERPEPTLPGRVAAHDGWERANRTIQDALDAPDADEENVAADSGLVAEPPVNKPN
jgi:hypothetical protein